MGKCVFVVVLLLLAVLTSLCYRVVRSDRILFSQGERLFKNKSFEQAALRYGPLLYKKTSIEKTILAKRLAVCYEATGNVHGAIFLYEQLFNKGPYDYHIASGLADAYVKTGRYDDAASLYGMILQRSPDDRKAMIGLARALTLARRYDEAIAMYKKVIR